MIGRQKERQQLLDAFGSEESEFVAVYGRRRVGKTYLIRETFNCTFTFQHTGVKKGDKEIQLERFRVSLQEQGHVDCPELTNWFEAFDQLKVVIKNSTDVRKVVFIDEIPWMGRTDASFVSAVENFWNAWASARKDILFGVKPNAYSYNVQSFVTLDDLFRQ